jgi:hypothetical protein
MNLRAFFLAVLSLAAGLLAGCASSSASSAAGNAKTYWIEALPEWQQPDRAQPILWPAVAAEVATLAPNAALLTSDAQFIRLNHAFALNVITWTRSFLAITHRGYVAESFDCDKFAKAFTLCVEMSAARAGVPEQPLAARIFVNQLEPFGGVPAGGGHALVALYTDQGVIIVEPQSGAWCPLAAYPNRNNIWRVTIGG